jgi:hypothetical protein
MKKLNRILAAALLVIMLCSALVSCDFDISGLLGGLDINDLFGNKTENEVEITEINIKNGNIIELQVGETIQIMTDVPEAALHLLKWTTPNSNIYLSGGTVTAISEGVALVIVTYGDLRESIVVKVVGEGANNGGTGNDQEDDDENQGNLGADEDPYGPNEDPYANITAEEFYSDYEPAISYYDSYWRSYHGFMSGELGEQDQAPTISTYRPVFNGDFVRNSVGIYGDNGNSYTVVDAYGRPVMKIYRGGGYIMLEEVAAHLFAFGEITANHTKSKSTKPTSSVWGEYLRLNHTKFSGSTTKYPYEPVLPDISGCGGNTVYYELDIGTTGTDCDPSYPSVIYNNGSSITRGAARIVYTVSDTNGNKIIDINEKYLFYTYNHYNDFQEYLNYYGGWGEMFGNITGGGTISSKYDYNPTPYVRTVRMDISKLSACVMFEEYFLVIDNKAYA